VALDRTTPTALPVVLLLAAVLFINYVDRGALPTAAHLVASDLALNEKQLGLLFSAFFWTYTLAQVPMGWLAERYGANRVLAYGLTLWAVATVCVGFAHSFPMLLGLRLLLGVGESVGFPCVAKLVAAVVPVRSLGMANGIVACGYLFGPAVGTFVGGMLMAEYGWRAAFVVFGGLSLLWLVPWSRVSLPERAIRRSEADAPALRAVLKQPALWGTALGLLSSNYVFYFMLAWLPYYLVRERGFSTVEMAQIAGAAYVINALSAVSVGWLTDRLIVAGHSANAVYKTIMAATHLGSIACMVCMAVGARPLALGALFGYQFLCGAQAAGLYAIPQILAGPHAAGRWVGIQNSVGSFAGVVAPAATGFIVDSTHRFTAAFLLAGAVSVLGLIGWLWMLPKLAELRWSGAAAPGAGAPRASATSAAAPGASAPGVAAPALLAERSADVLPAGGESL
jgi:MFS family permease